MTPPIRGLLLAGGRSSRMGQDKALLSYSGALPQMSRAKALLETVCHEVFLSIRAEQREQPVYSDSSAIVDHADAIGPMGGLLSAMAAYPDSAWLVMGCDMPQVTSQLLQDLIEQRSATDYATAYLHEDGSGPEPLCAIYEPRCYPLLSERAVRKQYSLRHFLMEVAIRSLEVSQPNALININTPESYRRWLMCHDIRSDCV